MITAIIDDGVYEKYFLISPILHHLQINSNNRIVEEIEMKPYISHGTICAAIVSDLCQGSNFISIKVLDVMGRGCVEHLITALEWCFNNHILLIQMSLGTADYHDFDKIEPIINKLTDNGTIIVSAYNNMNIPSYPAHLPKVFGVRHDRYHLLSDGMFLLDKMSGLREENSLVSHYNKTLKDCFGDLHPTEGANSYAASVITAQIITYLKYEPALSFSDILNKIKYFAQDVIYPDAFCNFTRWEENDITVPVIYILKDNIDTFKKIYYNFIDDEYAVDSFSETRNENTLIIPLHLYKAEGGISRGLISVLNKIYQPSVILVETSTLLSKKEIDWELIDICVEYRGHYFLNLKEDIFEFETVLEVYKAILNYF